SPSEMASGDTGSSDVELVYFKRCTDKLMSASTSAAKKLDLLRRLRQVKVNMQVLASSGIGKAVNACRDGSRSELDTVATELVNNWKRIVDSALTQRPELLSQPLPAVAEVTSTAKQKSSPSFSTEPISKIGNSSNSFIASNSDSKKSGDDSRKPNGDSKKSVKESIKQEISHSASSANQSSSCLESNKKPSELDKSEQSTGKIAAKPGVSFSLPVPPATTEVSTRSSSSCKAKKKKKKNRPESSLGEFDNTTGLTFGDCLELAASKRPNKKKKKKKQRAEALPQLPSELDLGISEDPAIAAKSAASLKQNSTTEDNNDGLAIPLKFHTRTAVYSGRSRSVYDTVPTLKQACLDYLAAHLDWLGAMGPGVPYHVIKPVLAKCNVEQLERLEAHNPHLIGDDDELWQLHFMRDFPDVQLIEDDGASSNSAPWRRRYIKSRRKQQAKLQSITERLANTQAQARSQQRKTLFTLIDKPPQRKRNRHCDDSEAPSLKFSNSSKTARSSANPERAQLVEQLSQHILPTASAPMSVHSGGGGGKSSGASTSGGARGSTKSAPLMSKTLKQVKRLKASGYYRV
ncbi:hypothetical protein BOX15_Mlig003496g4, partial [Macrostomum lignano]